MNQDLTNTPPVPLMLSDDLVKRYSEVKYTHKSVIRKEFTNRFKCNEDRLTKILKQKYLPTADERELLRQLIYKEWDSLYTTTSVVRANPEILNHNYTFAGLNQAVK